MAFGQACSTFTSQNIGANQVDWAKQGVKTSLFLGITVTISASVLTLCFSDFAFGLFSKEPAVIALGTKSRLLPTRSTSFTYFWRYMPQPFARCWKGASGHADRGDQYVCGPDLHFEKLCCTFTQTHWAKRRFIPDMGMYRTVPVSLL